MGLNQTETEITQQNVMVASMTDPLAKFYPEHLRTWVYGERERLERVREWIAEAAMDAAGMPVGGKRWSVVEHETKGIKQ